MSTKMRIKILISALAVALVAGCSSEARLASRNLSNAAAKTAQAQIEVRQAYLNDMRHLQRRREILENE